MIRKIFLMAAAAMLSLHIAFAANASPPEPASPAPESAAVVALYDGLGAVHHPVTTSSPLAQKYFDQGLAFVYGFNHYEAERSFGQAARIDPNMAMAYWGVALVLGPNYNLPGDEERGRRAFGAIKRSRALESNASPEERGLIEALARRYGSDGKETPALDEAYANAMRDVAHRYPADLDTQTLFAESLMDLHPWQLWNIDGKPGVNTIEIVTTLETVLKQAPSHIGANHYYIHAVEASPDPSRAMVSADRLGALAPAAGHLVHMPAHIYVRTGRYHSAATVNQNAIAADDAFLAKSKEGGVYPLMYYTHNVHFLCYALMMEGRERDAMDAARFLETHVPLAAVRQMPMAEFLVPIPYLVAARFGRWEFILKEPAPPNDLVYTMAIWHYARALAFAAGGRYDEAARERKGLEVVTAATPADRPLGTANRAKTVSEVAVAVLAGQLSSFKGDHVVAAASLSQAVRMQDALIYEEPPIWYFPVRETLGGELLAEGRLPQAEAVLREDLKLNPNNPRSLYALSQCLRAEGKGAEAAKVEAEFNNAWRYADSKPAPIKIARAND